MKKIFSILFALSLVISSGTIVFASSSADESLDELKVSKSSSTSSSKLYDLFPEFDPEVGDYSVFLPDGTDSTYIYMKPDDSDYTVYCEGEEIDEDDDYFAYIDDIEDGDEARIVVKDEDEDTLDTYTITFYCGDEEDNDETDLEELVIKNKTGSSTYTNVDLDNDFDSDTSSYTCDIAANTYKTVRVYAEASDSSAHVLVNGNLVNSNGYAEVDVFSGTNKFEVKVIAENCDDIKTYTINADYQEDVEAALSGLTARDSTGKNLSLSPAFSSNKQNYTTYVSNNIGSINFYLTGNDGCSIYINDAVQSNTTWTQNYSLNEGVNNFKITVKATSGSYDTTTYNVSVYKQPKSLETSVSNQKLSINGISQSLNAYNINGNNFVKLRDVASLLSGTAKQFSVSYDETANRINLISSGYYTSNGQENMGLSRAQTITASEQSVYLDSIPANLMTYNIDGNNYVMLRDLGLLFNFGISYNSATDTIEIATTKSYSIN